MSPQNSHDDGTDTNDDSMSWHHCGFILGRNGVRRSIFVHLDCCSTAAGAGRGFGLRLLRIGAAAPEGRPAAKEIWRDPEPLIKALRRAGPFRPEEQDEFAASVEDLASLYSTEPGPGSDADALFNEILSQGMGGWRCIGSRSGSSVFGSFSTTIYARREHGTERRWTVLERGRDGNGCASITDDGSGDSIFIQFMRQYYSAELQNDEDAYLGPDSGAPT